MRLLPEPEKPGGGMGTDGEVLRPVEKAKSRPHIREGPAQRREVIGQGADFGAQGDDLCKLVGPNPMAQSLLQGRSLAPVAWTLEMDRCALIRVGDGGAEPGLAGRGQIHVLPSVLETGAEDGGRVQS